MVSIYVNILVMTLSSTMLPLRKTEYLGRSMLCHTIACDSEIIAKFKV